jgi:hypothetical protein
MSQEWNCGSLFARVLGHGVNVSSHKATLQSQADPGLTHSRVGETSGPQHEQQTHSTSSHIAGHAGHDSHAFENARVRELSDKRPKVGNGRDCFVAGKRALEATREARLRQVSPGRVSQSVSQSGQAASQRTRNALWDRVAGGDL